MKKISNTASQNVLCSLERLSTTFTTDIFLVLHNQVWKDDPIQVVKLVKVGSGQQSSESVVAAETAGLLVGGPDNQGTANDSGQARIGQTSLLTLLRFLRGFAHSGVDANETFTVVLKDEEPLGDTDLRRSQADAALLFHKDEHIEQGSVKIKAGIARIQWLALQMETGICVGY